MAHPAADPMHIEACVLRTLGDLAGAARLLEGLVDRETSYGRLRAADRYRRDLDAIELSIRRDHAPPRRR